MPTGRFDYFAILAGMRTGSNLLEELLAAMPGIVCHGELFNPHFFGRPKGTERFGLTMDRRDADPVAAIGAMRAAGGGLPGFRLFHDHDVRAVVHVLNDPRAAKIVLTRSPLDSYVSLKIARRTGQWWLGDAPRVRRAKVTFDAEEYAEFLDETAGFGAMIERALQDIGQTAFRIAYHDLGVPQVIAGLGRFLGAEGTPDAAKVRAKVQNPAPLAERLTNPEAAEVALRQIATPDLSGAPVHEPVRGPGVKFFHACAGGLLLYMPVRGAAADPVPAWLAAADPGGEVETGLTRKALRRWKRQHPGHLSFSVLRHPLARAYDAFCRYLPSEGPARHCEVRHALIHRYGVPLPKGGAGPGYEEAEHRAGFLAFLTFLAANLGGQTALRVDNAWASQEVLLRAVAGFAVPDRVIREERLTCDLARLAADAGVPVPASPARFAVEAPFPLSRIHDAGIDAACAAAYRRDYEAFGFRDWQPEN